MKAVDHYTIHEVGIPSLVLMERAALAVADCALKAARAFAAHSPVWALCGVGNEWSGCSGGSRMVYLKWTSCSYFSGQFRGKGDRRIKAPAFHCQEAGDTCKKMGTYERGSRKLREFFSTAFSVWD